MIQRRSSPSEFGAVHIVGVGGSATRGLAHLLKARGVSVTGSDLEDSGALVSLREDGMRVHAGHRAENLHGKIDVVVRSAAVPADNPELVAAEAQGIPVRKYAEMLGDLVGEKRGIAVAGTHGKTSTAGMLASVFLAAGEDPSILIGGHHPQLGGNWRAGGGDVFIAEACEFDRSFLSLHPAVALITNLERDHPDIYPDESSLDLAFQEFVDGLNEPSILVINGDQERLQNFRVGSHTRCVDFGFGPGRTWRARVIRRGPHPRFRVLKDGKVEATVTLQVPGQHSVANALGAYAVAAELGLAADVIREGLESFPGIDRRFQLRGSPGGVELIDDFAHHPTEVLRTLETLRDVYPDRTLWAVFQPHQYGRLAAFATGFADALSLADRVVLLPVYSVREATDGCAPLELLDRLAGGVRARGTPVVRMDSLTEARDALAAELQAGEVCVFLGAGDVFRLTESVRDRLGPCI